MADCGVGATQHLLKAAPALEARQARNRRPVPGRAGQEGLLSILQPARATPRRSAATSPYIIMIAGVNGSGQDHDLHRQARQALPEPGQERAAGRRRHLPRRRPRAADDLGRAQRRGRHRPGIRRPGRRGVRRHQRRPRPQHRHRAGRHRRPPAHPAAPDGRNRQGAPGHPEGRAPGPTRSLLVLDANIGQNALQQVRPSTPPSASPAWSSPNSTAPPRAAWWRPSPARAPSRCASSAWASRSTTCKPSAPRSSSLRCGTNPPPDWGSGG